VSSLWCNIHGHRVPAIDAAIRAQLDRVAHSTLLGLASEPSIRFASALVDRAPAGLNHVFYSDNGSTAVEAALKIAYQYHQQRTKRPGRRDLFVCLSGAYHGDTLGSVSVGGIDLFHSVYGNLLFRTVKVPAPAGYRRPLGMTADDWSRHALAVLERTIVENHRRIAGFVIEPLAQGAAAVLVHPPGYLRRVRELTAEYDIPLIADEVATGFGRTGTFLACEQEQVRPDLLCLSKGITGGYLPLAATLVTDEIYSAFLAEPAEAKTFFHGHTYTGNPLACAAALASLALFEENRVLDNVQILSERLKRRLAEMAHHRHVGEIRQKGIMVGIELVRDRATKEPFPPAARIGHRIALAARNRAVIVRPIGDVLILMPAPAMPEMLVDELCTATFAAADEVLSAVT
jgi:adenosylmethionine-8-amino-7-oxononanoate aminotransferase